MNFSLPSSMLLLLTFFLFFTQRFKERPQLLSIGFVFNYLIHRPYVLIQKREFVLNRVKLLLLLGYHVCQLAFRCLCFYQICALRRKEEMVQKILHEPQLDTILMVENAIREAKTYPTRRELLKSLLKQIQYQTFNRILEYLQSSNKIVFDGRRIIWVFAENPKLRGLLEGSVKLR